MIGPLRFIGRKQAEIATSWFGSASVYGATAGALMVYLTDWRVIVDYLPFYNGKFPSEDKDA